MRAIIAPEDDPVFDDRIGEALLNSGLCPVRDLDLDPPVSRFSDESTPHGYANLNLICPCGARLDMDRSLRRAALLGPVKARLPLHRKENQ